MELVEPKMEKRIPKFLIEEDVINLKITCDSPREHSLLEFLYCTGCRIGEVHKLDVEDINWESYSAIVHGKGLEIMSASHLNGVLHYFDIGQNHIDRYMDYNECAFNSDGPPQ